MKLSGEGVWDRGGGFEQNRKKKTCRPSRSKRLKPLMHHGRYVKLVHTRLSPPRTRRVCRNMVGRLAYLHLTINTHLKSETSKPDARDCRAFQMSISSNHISLNSKRVITETISVEVIHLKCALEQQNLILNV